MQARGMETDKERVREREREREREKEKWQVSIVERGNEIVLFHRFFSYTFPPFLPLFLFFFSILFLYAYLG